MNKVMVLAVHPDDETLGCGGTLLRHKAEGDRIYWTIATCMKPGRGFTKEECSKRETEIGKVFKSYRFDGLDEINIQAAATDRISQKELVEKISAVFNKVRPGIVYLPFRGDIHSDHRTIFEAAYSCTKTFRYPFIRKVLMMETPSETEFAMGFEDSVFNPNHFVDITKFLKRKLDIMKIYKDEIGKDPFPRSLAHIRSLAHHRGAFAGFRYAEAFMLLKEIR